MEFLAQFHPQIIHFPIVLLLLYVLFETIGVVFKRDFFSKSAHLILFLGVLAAVAAVLTGQQAFNVASSWEEKGAIIQFGAIHEHENWATLTLWYFAALLVIRTFITFKKKFTGYFQYLFVVLALVGAFFVFETGDHGGHLVYKYGIGTDLKKAEIEK
ncbi:MAG TPA: DUF2231 domain-containing protein [Ignavibacteriaceae bacterium]|nr:DUF2231 domain-containing protein [Ignavibacteriaceae bacterium]